MRKREPETVADAGLRAGRFDASLTGIFLLGMLLRSFAVIFYLRANRPEAFFERGLEMGYMANAFAHGQGLSSPLGGTTGPTAMFAPIYPWIASLSFRAFGPYSAHAAVSLVLVHLLANVVTLWLVMWIALRLSERKTARVAGLIWACSPPLWFIPSIFWDTSFSLLLMTGVVAAGIWAERRRTSGALAWYGLYCGVAGIFNPAFVPALVAIFAGMGGVALRNADRRGGVYRVVVGALLFVAVYSFWPVRNALVMHAFVPLRSAASLDLWMGNHPGATGYLEFQDFPVERFNAAQYREYLSKGEIAYTHDLGRAAQQTILEHPATFVSLSGRRFVRFWAGSGSSNGSTLFVVHATLTTLSGMVGLWLLARRRRWTELLLFGAPLLLFPLPYYITHAEFRFRLVIDPLLTVLAAYALVEFARIWREGREAAIERAETILVG